MGWQLTLQGRIIEIDVEVLAALRDGMIGVIIHEVGHVYVPMIINTDERQWTWMDEGLNTFTQFLAEQEWEKGYPSRRGEPRHCGGESSRMTA